jgi:hypothetical protein
MAAEGLCVFLVCWFVWLGFSVSVVVWFWGFLRVWLGSGFFLAYF